MNRKTVWLGLALVALATRLAVAFFLPNAELDGYSYVERIVRYAAALRGGTFSLSELFDFWLPLYPLAGAVVNLVIPDALIAGKLIAALCGAASCLMVALITERLTGRMTLAVLAFALVLVNPLHFVYSAAAMTDIPFGLLLLLTVWLALGDRWMGAAICAALGGLLRIEMWIFLALLPALQWSRQRRVSPALPLLLLTPIALWLLIGYAATGDALAYFQVRDRYQASYIEMYPTRYAFKAADVLQDIDYFLMGASHVVFAAALLVFGLAIGRMLRDRPLRLDDRGLVASVLFVITAFLVFAYVTKKQPVLLPRYGLFSLALGLPLFVWLLGSIHARKGWGRGVAVVLVLVYLVQAESQLVIVGKIRRDFVAHQKIVAALLPALGPDARCFADDVAVRVLSGLPRTRFIDSHMVGQAEGGEAERFTNFLRAQKVLCLIYTRSENSIPVKVYPQMGKAQAGEGDAFELIAHEPSDFGPDIWLYRLK